ncbi:UDP-N-acetylmuramate dehydrogenase [Lactonifactor longoviformis]|uniref:UDP-N-acetylenolpyruvoylglucosamine reductase n=1 Tax=Lactonifactor longoviformis DSM 17459 TaxID=1122155 RepID=A0A1M4UCE2_9CLOT|nr:UDP-N-acetylmuramate dehydrogenase [Lactonifactor longoviformis]POP30761.1 UDP-N-acetylmuramate dehydrogenase [Lactonifactor longoviformis]SHE54409.1 UDP-N-acetylmuramate dehydrogenase [Lactonifactor longoviformis DSM 17459]
MKENIVNEFCSIVGSDNVWTDEPMCNHTTFRIGGPADYYLCPHSIEEIQRILHTCQEAEVPYFILGNGSNLLVSDKGYRGAIIQIYRNLSDILVEGTLLTVKAGALLSQVARKAMEYGLTGFEFAGGIPGTLGGAVVMNAGAYGGEMKDVLQEVVVMTNEGEVCCLKAEELKLGYRTSIIKESGYIVLEAAIRLMPGEKEKIRERMNELRDRRVSKQPLEYPSAGSTFKRPQGYFAGKLIMDAGLRGFAVGNAQVSDKHCGFVINNGNATAEEVRELIRQIIERVYENSNVTLEPEVKFLGEF